MYHHCLFLALEIVCNVGGGILVPRWEPYDIVVHSDKLHENPFIVNLYAKVEGPNGESFLIPGFYDGVSQWKIRFSPTSEGEWTLTTVSEEAELGNKVFKVSCIPNNNPNVHGALKVDGRNFVFEDSTRFFMMAYECDWLWALDMGNPSLPTLLPFLDKLQNYGFNCIILNVYAHDTPWCKGKTSDKDYGPPPMFPWEGDNDAPVHSKFNIEFWKHYDRMMRALYDRGIVAHIMIKVYNKMVNWPPKGSNEDDLYFRYVIARYSAYPNVIWDFSKEANNEKDLDYKLGRFKFIRQNDPYRRLITSHDDRSAYDSGVYNDILDFRSDQQHSNWHESLLEHRAQNDWPVVNVEFGYEHGPKGIEDKTYNVVQPPEEVCRRAWEICLAGGYIAYYYTYTAWDVLIPEDTPPGYFYFRNLRNFFERTHYWLMEPADKLVSSGYCLANDGREYIVFLNEAQDFTIKLPEGAGLNCVWFNPYTGEAIETSSIASGITTFSSPTKWGKIPVALHIRIN